MGNRERKGPDEEYFKTFKHIEVEIPSGERLDEHIKRFRALVTKERIMSDLKEHQAYEKPSEKKRRKQREAIQRRRKMERAIVEEPWKAAKSDKNNKKRSNEPSEE